MLVNTLNFFIKIVHYVSYTEANCREIYQTLVYATSCLLKKHKYHSHCGTLLVYTFVRTLLSNIKIKG